MECFIQCNVTALCSFPGFQVSGKGKGKRYAASLVKRPDRKCITFVTGLQVRPVLTMFLSGDVK